MKIALVMEVDGPGKLVVILKLKPPSRFLSETSRGKLTKENKNLNVYQGYIAIQAIPTRPDKQDKVMDSNPI